MVKLTHLFTALMGTVAIASPAMFNRKDIQAHLCDMASDSDTGLTLGGPPEAPELTTIIIGYDHLSCDSPEGKFNLQAGKCYDWDFPSLRLMYRRCGQVSVYSGKDCGGGKSQVVPLESCFNTEDYKTIKLNNC